MMLFERLRDGGGGGGGAAAIDCGAGTPVADDAADGGGGGGLLGGGGGGATLREAEACGGSGGGATLRACDPPDGGGGGGGWRAARLGDALLAAVDEVAALSLFPVFIQLLGSIAADGCDSDPNELFANGANLLSWLVGALCCALDDCSPL